MTDSLDDVRAMSHEARMKRPTMFCTGHRPAGGQWTIRA